MTISKQERIEDVSRALGLMLEYIGDDIFNARGVNTHVAPYNVVKPTTWFHLAKRGWATSHQNGRYCTLTGSGWLKAIVTTNRDRDKNFQKDIGRIMAVLKGYVNGRDGDAFVNVQDVATLSGISTEFITNVIESDAITLQQHKHGAHWDRGHPLLRICVPRDFGMEILDSDIA